MKALYESLSWYQTKISNYDKQYWELSAEQRILQGLERRYRTNSATTVTQENCEFIDVDLIRGYTFSAQPPSTVYNPRHVFTQGVLKAVVAPWYYQFWSRHISPQFARLIVAHYFMCIVYLLAHKFTGIPDNKKQAHRHDHVLDSVLLAPLSCLLLLSVLHAHIIEPNQQKKKINNGTSSVKRRYHGSIIGGDASDDKLQSSRSLVDDDVFPENPPEDDLRKASKSPRPDVGSRGLHRCSLPSSCSALQPPPRMHRRSRKTRQHKRISLVNIPPEQQPGLNKENHLHEDNLMDTMKSERPHPHLDTRAPPPASATRPLLGLLGDSSAHLRAFISAKNKQIPDPVCCTVSTPHILASRNSICCSSMNSHCYYTRSRYPLIEESNTNVDPVGCHFSAPHLDRRRSHPAIILSRLSISSGVTDDLLPAEVDLHEIQVHFRRPSCQIRSSLYTTAETYDQDETTGKMCVSFETGLHKDSSSSTSTSPEARGSISQCLERNVNTPDHRDAAADSSSESVYSRPNQSVDIHSDYKMACSETECGSVTSEVVQPDVPHSDSSVSGIEHAQSEDDSKCDEKPHDYRNPSRVTSVTPTQDPEDPFILWFKETHNNGGQRFGTCHPTLTETVGCFIWEDKSLKKTALTLLDMGWSIIQSVEKQVEDPTYVQVAVWFVLLLSILPCICEFLLLKDDLTLVSTGENLPKVWSCDFMMRIGLPLLAFLLRLGAYSCLAALLLVTEKSLQQRLEYAKHFCHVTSSRRARKHHLPHFRLNKVRNIKFWVCLRSYLKRRGPQRSVDSVTTAAFYAFFTILTILCFRHLMSSASSNWRGEMIYWDMSGLVVFLGVFLVRYITLASKMAKKYCNLSVLLTEQINLYLSMDAKPHKRADLQLANNTLKLAEGLLKEVDGPYRVCGWSMNPLVYNVLKVLILSACSAILSEYCGFKLKLYKIKLNPLNW